ncbi:MAG: AAA family ATPase [Tannerellaceae bacterium]|jgi:exonuclease SbcC|nr:AAA family ATPase [Tannerellaceae bacterium]
MKVLAIRGKNIASLEGVFEIDFTREPLSSAGIFAITGSTGSGKSTLLDVLCLALFGNTPRMSVVTENKRIVTDVGNETISQDDCRTLLRRGTAEGYAEADFISLDGTRYRSTWLVRRARGKADGALQKTEMRLINLDAGNEIQGVKGELEKKVEELIGLTFAQFTRAVLLAQGDFATFLKARQPEKAELLEKLTGSEIYSQISVVIHEKKKEAAGAYLAMRQRIQAIDTLPSEQLAAYEEERNILSAELPAAQNTLDIIIAKLKWISDLEALIKNIKLSEEILNGINKKTADAAPRFDLIARIESVQHMRDGFNSARSLLQQTETDEAELAEAASRYDTLLARLKEASDTCAANDEILRGLNAEWETVQPALREARDLDIKIAGGKANLEDTQREIAKAISEKLLLEQSLLSLVEEMEAAQAEMEAAGARLLSLQPFAPLIPDISLIIELLNDLDSTGAKRREAVCKLEKNEAGLKESESGLKRAQIELNNIGSLPGMALQPGIVALRAGLTSGEPCPLCGSRHHPVKDMSEEQIKEAERLNERISRLASEVEKSKAAVASSLSQVENYSSRYAELYAKTGNLLQLLPEWENEPGRRSLASTLKSAAAGWDSSSRQEKENKEIVSRNNTLIESGRSRLQSLLASLDEKQAKEASQLAALKILAARRSELLDGRNASDIDSGFSQKRKEAELNAAKARQASDKLLSDANILKGSIEQLQRNITARRSALDNANAALDRLLEQSPKPISRSELQNLFSKDIYWIQKEKEALAGLEKQKTIALANLNLYRSQLDNHREQPLKPSETEPPRLIEERRNEITLRIDFIINRVATIKAILNRDAEARNQIASLSAELERTSLRNASWEKLDDLLGSANGSKFKEIAQGYTLDTLLAHANRSLKDLSRRYVLQRIAGTLALQVIDLDMLGEVRTVHSLSGGESFLLSLALALGLSSLSTERMKIESLFIDEGFGSLDVDSLRLALHALERLQTQGRKIGVISHVAEMTESIAARINVQKLANGRSELRIEG